MLTLLESFFSISACWHTEYILLYLTKYNIHNFANLAQEVGHSTIPWSSQISFECLLSTYQYCAACTSSGRESPSWTFRSRRKCPWSKWCLHRTQNKSVIRSTTVCNDPPKCDPHENTRCAQLQGVLLHGCRVLWHKTLLAVKMLWNLSWHSFRRSWQWFFKFRHRELLNLAKTTQLLKYDCFSVSAG